MDREVRQSMVNEMVAQLKRQHFLSLDSQSINVIKSLVFLKLDKFPDPDFIETFCSKIFLIKYDLSPSSFKKNNFSSLDAITNLVFDECINCRFAEISSK